jgi:electron transfer flavoprotein beta subunit
MKTVVLLRMVPDVVEELEIGGDGKSLESEGLRTILSECDEHALEQALLLKERHGGEVTVVAPESLEVDEALFTALAKGADRALKIEGAGESLSALEAALLLEQALEKEPGLLPADLILTGVQAISDVDALVAPLLAEKLRLPFVGIVTRVTMGEGGRTATVVKEFPGGVRGEYEVDLPAVLGIQAAEKPPRYVPVAKVRAVMRSQRIDRVPAPAPADRPQGVEIVAMRKPEAASNAEMLEGEPEEVAGKLCDVLSARGVL